MTTQQAAALDFMNKLPTNHFIHKRMSSFLKSIIKKKSLVFFLKACRQEKRRTKYSRKRLPFFHITTNICPYSFCQGFIAVRISLEKEVAVKIAYALSEK